MQPIGFCISFRCDGPLVASISGGRVTRRARLGATKPLAPVVASCMTCGAFTLTGRLPSGGRLERFRARVLHDRGPGCYLIKRSRRPDDAIAEQMLVREATVSALVTHPNLTCILARSEDDGGPFNVLPFLDGVSGRQVMFAAGSAGYKVAAALALGRQIAAALGALHDAGWLHGQVGPNHVILSPQGQAALIDLTLARRLDCSECVVGRERFTTAFDIQALGSVLYELLAGSPPIDARSHGSARQADLRSLRGDVSLDVSELISRMLATEPLRRPSAEQVVRWCAELEIEELA